MRHTAFPTPRHEGAEIVIEEATWQLVSTAPRGKMVRLSGYRETGPTAAENVEGDGMWSERGWETEIPAGSVIMHWRPIDAVTAEGE